MFPFCSKKVKPHPPTGNLFFRWAPGKIFATPGRVDVGGRICRKANGFENRTGRTRQAQRSGYDIRRDLVFDESDAVAQLQFAFLQPL